MLFLEHKSLEISKAKPSFMLARVSGGKPLQGIIISVLTSHQITDGRDEIYLFYCVGIVLLTLLMLFPSGNTDIQNGNMKLILGLIWSLIAHYQLGASNFPPKKLMLAWLKVSAQHRAFLHLPHYCSTAVHRLAALQIGQLFSI